MWTSVSGSAYGDGVRGEETHAGRRRRRRSDAELNASRVIRAANALFAEQGSTATVEEVAARAGVGRATVYRSFPTRANLVRSMTEQRIQWMLDRLRQALAAQDITTEFPVFIHDVMLRVLDDRVLGEVVAPPVRADAGPAAEMEQLMNALVTRAQAAGCIGARIDPVELGWLLSGLVLALIARGDSEPDNWHRAAQLIIRACR